MGTALLPSTTSPPVVSAYVHRLTSGFVQGQYLNFVNSPENADALPANPSIESATISMAIATFGVLCSLSISIPHLKSLDWIQLPRSLLRQQTEV
jgi:hypothetical protein